MHAAVAGGAPFGAAQQPFQPHAQMQSEPDTTCFARYRRRQRPPPDGAAAAANGVANGAAAAADAAAPTAAVAAPSAADADAALDAEAEEEMEGRILTDAHIAVLLRSQLRTAEDVLCVSVPRWPDKPEFPRALFLKFRSIIRDTLHCGVVTGVDLWQRHLQARCIDTGNQQLNNILGGGVFSQEITEIVGASCSGKTQLCVQIAFHCAAAGDNVMVIDTGCSFDVTRGRTLIIEHAKLHGSAMPSEAAANIRVMQVFTSFNLLAQLDRLRQAWQYQQLSPPRLLVIDSLAGVIAPHSGASSRGFGVMTAVARAIKALAFDFNIAILTTNYTVSRTEEKVSMGQLQPALGESWSLTADTRVQMLSNAHNFTISLTKSPRKAVGVNCTLELGPAGFQSPSPNRT